MNFRERRYGEVRRIPLLRGWMNKDHHACLTADFIVVGPIGSGVGPWTACNGPVSELVHVMSANAAAIRYMRHSALGLQRIHLPRTRVKEGKKSRGRGC